MKLPDLATISHELRVQAYSLALQLAPGGRRHGQEYDAPNPVMNDGKLGKFSVNLAKGVFADFRDSAVSGDMLSFVGYCVFGDAKAISEARKWALHYLGYTTKDGAQLSVSPEDIAKRKAEAEAKAAARDREEQRQANLKRRAAGRVWGQAQKLDGEDPASLYLRGRNLDLRSWPYLQQPIRVTMMEHPGTPGVTHPTMIMAVRALDVFLTVHRTYLMPDHKGGFVKLSGPDLRPDHDGKPLKAKLAFSAYRGGAVWFHPWAGWPPEDPRRKWPPVMGVSLSECGLAEGGENALSVAMSVPHLWHAATVSLGNLGHVELPKGMRPIVFRDNDEPGSPADRGLTHSLTRLYERGFPPRVTAAPEGVKDANDLLQQDDDDDAQ